MNQGFSGEPFADKKQNIFDCGVGIRRESFAELLAAAVGWSAVTQSRASDFVVMRRDWRASFDEGVLRFGEDGYPMQILGAESEEKGVFCWSWAGGGYRTPYTEAAAALRAFGESGGAAVFCAPQFRLTSLYSGQNIAAAAAMLSEKPACFFRCPFEGGAVYVLFGDLPQSIFLPVSLHVFIATLMQIIRQFPIDHRIMAEAFLSQNQTPFQREGHRTVAQFPRHPPLDITFDEFHRVVGIRART